MVAVIMETGKKLKTCFIFSETENLSHKKTFFFPDKAGLNQNVGELLN